MRKIRHGFVALCLLLCSVASAEAQVSIGIGLPNVSIGINLPLFPDLVPVPGYPVYYAPRLDANYFFYDGMYWVFHGDSWYVSSWYNGPWWIVEPYDVPLFILRVPVRYYRQPPVFFRGWRANAPPRWGRHWGHDWEKRRRGWNRWDRGSAPRPAPLPVYQRQYTGDRYPRVVEQQQTLRSRNYRYQPRETIVRRHYGQRAEQRAPAPAGRERMEGPPGRGPREQEMRRPEPIRQGEPRLREERRRPEGVELERRSPGQPVRSPREQDIRRQEQPRQEGPQPREQRRRPEGVELERRSPGPPGQGPVIRERKESREPREGRGEREMKGEERGRERK